MNQDRQQHPHTDENFEAAVEKSLHVLLPEKGQRLRGKILLINEATVLIDCGATSEALLDPRELDDEKVGDEIEVVVTEIEPAFTVSKKLIDRTAGKESLRRAFEGGIPVMGKILEAVKGGLRVDVSGHRAFLPIGQLDLKYVSDPTPYLNQTYEMKIIEFDAENNNIVVSRAELLKKAAQDELAKFWNSLEIGQVVAGTVTSLQTYGAFVAIGPVEGLLHISEITEGYVGHPSEVLQVGQKIQVKIIKANRDQNRISLSMKALQEDHWETKVAALNVGSEYAGVITQKTEYGLFVRLHEGPEGLLHISQLQAGHSIDDEMYQIGKNIHVRVRAIDRDKHRISLTERQPEADHWQGVSTRLHADQVLEGKIEEITKFGIFVELEPGVTGLIPFSELRKLGYRNPNKEFPVGFRCAVRILSIDEARRRIALLPEGRAARPSENAGASVPRKQQKRAPAPREAEKNEPASNTVSEFGALLLQALRKESRS